jgi:hypothetical protein
VARNPESHKEILLLFFKLAEIGQNRVFNRNRAGISLTFRSAAGKKFYITDD